MGFTKRLQTANGWVNLGTLMRAAGYTGGGLISSLTIFNTHASSLFYLHLTAIGTGTSPAGATGLDGLPFGVGASAIGNAFYSDRGANAASLDIGTTWIFAASTIDIIVAAVGT
jgi:hypothetical protein